MSSESKWHDSELASAVDLAIVILSVLLGIGGCFHIARTGTQTEQNP